MSEVDSGTSKIVRPAPIILLGRGGSGTRLLSEIALGLGVFLGNEINVSGDSVEWVETIYDLVVEDLTSSDFTTLDRNQRCHSALRACAEHVLSRGVYAGQAWGWKLPETMLVARHALSAFPTAKVVHLTRHPITSAIRRTHMTSRLDNRVGGAVLPAAYRAIGRDDSLICTDEIFMHNAITWDFQMRRVLPILQAEPGRVLQIQYEAICDNPAAACAGIAAFTDLERVEKQNIPEVDVKRTIDIPLIDERAALIWEICGETAEVLGYDRNGLASIARPLS